MSQQRLRRGNWSVQEMERLRLLLPNRGVEQTALLLRRSPDSVLRKALDLLRVPPRRGAWTESDDWQLRQAWGAVEIRLLAPMLGRPSSEVRQRAGQLRQHRSQGDWTRAELQLLKKLYGTRSDADLEVSLMRSSADIAAAAQRLCLAKDKRFQAAQASSDRALANSRLANGVRVSGAKVLEPGAGGKGSRERAPMPRWTSAEVERLRALYPDQDNLTVARALGRSVTSVANKAYQLGIHKTAELLTTIGRSNIALRYTSDEGCDSRGAQDADRPPASVGGGPAVKRPAAEASERPPSRPSSAGGNDSSRGVGQPSQDGQESNAAGS